MGNLLLNSDGSVATEGRRIHPDFALVIAPDPIRELVSSLRLLHHQACDRAAYVLEAMIRERTLTLELLDAMGGMGRNLPEKRALMVEMGLRVDEPRPPAQEIEARRNMTDATHEPEGESH